MDATQRLLLCSVLIGVAGISTAPLALAQSAGTTTGMTLAAIETAYSEYERIEVSFGPTQVKVEAVDADTGQTVEAIYDRLTGEILKQETGTVSGPVGKGVEVKSRMEDFVRARASDRAEDGLDHAFGDHHRRGGDDAAEEDDSAASADDGADDANDDHGGGHGRSGGEGNSDNRGGDRGGDRGKSGDDHSDHGGSDDDGDDD